MWMTARESCQRRVFVGVLIAVGLLALPSRAVALTDYSWGGGGFPNSFWSNSANWTGGGPPSGSVGMLSFPQLPSSACSSSGQTCPSNNDLAGVSATGISIDTGTPYVISGNGISLGSGGITASFGVGVGRPEISLPLALTAAQTWSINGGPLRIDGNVTGSASALTINGGVNFLGADVEVGPVSIGGGGFGYIGSSLNGSDHNSVSFSGGGRLEAIGNGSTGPLTMTDGTLAVVNATVLGVEGAASFASTSTLILNVEANGTTAGTDYSQLSATGDVDLGGANLDFAYQFPGCPPLPVGNVYTLVTTAGSLSGTFHGLPDYTRLPLDCSGGTPPTLQINYTPQSVIATVVAGGSGTPTTTTLSAGPANPVTNQGITMTATVSSSATPSGTVEFTDDDTAISGCANQPLNASGAATCETSLAASSSPAAVQAVFMPGASGFQSSASKPVALAINKDGTAAALGVSDRSPVVGKSGTYTAAVVPIHGGSVKPSGSVQFLDGEVPISGCSSQPLTVTSSSYSTASCSLSYPTTGSHSITVSYSGDRNFTGSSSASRTVTVGSSVAGSKAAITTAKIDRKHHQATFTINAIGATGFQCALVKVKKTQKHHKQPKPKFSACSSPETYQYLERGKYTFEVRAISHAAPGPIARRNFKI